MVKKKFKITKKKHKFAAVKVERDNRTFHSKLEAAVYDMLKLMAKFWGIEDIKCQVHVRFHTYDHGKIHMIPDFSAYNKEINKTVYYEAKGFITREWLRKKKAWAIGGPGPLFVYGGSYKNPKLIETIIPKGEKDE